MISPSMMALQLRSGAVVSAAAARAFSPAELHYLSAANALRPISVRVELGPYSLCERCFTQSKVPVLSVPDAPPAATTRYKRIM